MNGSQRKFEHFYYRNEGGRKTGRREGEKEEGKKGEIEKQGEKDLYRELILNC